MNTYTVKLHADPENPVEVIAEDSQRAHAIALARYDHANGHTQVRGATIRLKLEDPK